MHTADGVVRVAVNPSTQAPPEAGRISTSGASASISLW